MPSLGVCVIDKQTHLLGLFERPKTTCAIFRDVVLSVSGESEAMDQRRWGDSKAKLSYWAQLRLHQPHVIFSLAADPVRVCDLSHRRKINEKYL
jgi:hypothetical protein